MSSLLHYVTRERCDTPMVVCIQHNSLRKVVKNYGRKFLFTDKYLIINYLVLELHFVLIVYVIALHILLFFRLFNE